jgi:carbon storage regulator CsrA
MLVLSRKLNQEIVIGDGIKVRILKIKGNTVRLGIDAPRDVKVIRGELPVQQDLPKSPEANAKPVAAEPSVTSVSATTPDAEAAEITIVFSNETKTPAVKTILPFPGDRTTPKLIAQPKSTEAGRLQDKSAFEPQPPASIQFRERLPESLGHNRLKEIVKQMTNKK